jgi:hypothetical protein
MLAAPPCMERSTFRKLLVVELRYTAALVLRWSAMSSSRPFKAATPML